MFFMGFYKTNNILFLIGFLTMLTAIITLHQSCMVMAEDEDYVFQNNLTYKPSISDIEVGPDGMIVEITKDYLVYAYKLENDRLVEKWHTTEPRVWSSGTYRLLNIAKTNITGEEKTIVIAYKKTDIIPDKGDIYFLDIETGNDLTPPIRDLVADFHHMKAPTKPRGDHLYISLSRYIKLYIIKYYANGSYQFYDMGSNWYIYTPSYLDFSPEGTKLAVVKGDRVNITIFDLTRPDWNETGITYAVPVEDETIRTYYIKWLNEKDLLIITNERITIDNNDYIKMLILDTESNTTKEILANLTDVNLSSIYEDYLDDNGNLVFVFELNDDYFLTVFNKDNVEWENDTIGYHHFLMTPFATNTDTHPGSMDIGQGMVYYISEGGYTSNIQEYSIIQQGNNKVVQLQAKKTFLRKADENNAIKAIGDDELIITMQLSYGSLSAETGGTYIYRLDTNTGALYNIDYIPLDIEYHGSTKLHKILLVNSIALSPDGTKVAIGGGLEDTFFFPDISPYNEKAMIIAYDLATGQRIFTYNVTFDQSTKECRNVFVPTITFLDNNKILAAIEYHNYTGQPTIVNKVLVLDLENGQELLNYTFTVPFIPGDLDAKALYATGTGDTIYTLYSYQETTDDGVAQKLAMKTIDIGSSPPGVTTTELLTITGDEHTGILITGATLSTDQNHLYVAIIDKKEVVINGDNKDMPESHLLKINLSQKNIEARLNITSSLLDQNYLIHHNEERVGGELAGLLPVGESLMLYIEKIGYMDPGVNALFVDKELNIEGNISLITQEEEAGVTTIDNYGLSFSDYSPTSHHIDETGNQPTIFMLSDEAIHKLTGQTTGQPAGGGEEEAPENDTGNNVILFTEEQREVILEADKIEKQLDNITTTLMETQEDALKNTENIKEILQEINIEDVMNDLVDKGLIRKIVKFPEDGREALRRTLESIYGPLLINYPSPIGRLYLLYTLYYLQ